MKYIKILISSLGLLLSLSATAQKNLITDKELSDQEQIEFYYNHELYLKSYNLSKLYLEEISKTANDISDFSTWQDVRYYNLASGLAINAPNIINKVDQYLSDPNTPEYYFERICAVTGNYYFQNSEYLKAIPFLINAGVVNLSENELYRKRFQLGYAYFLDKNFEDALYQFSALTDITNPYQSDANYYKGLIAFGQGKYREAEYSFRYIENHPKYQNIIPYYIAEIYYYNEDLEKCISYAQKYASKPNLEYRENYYALLAQAYFEKKNYSATISEFNKARDLGYVMLPNQNYSMGYAYYKEGNVDSAIVLFRPLAQNRDSVGQNAMYLLAD